MKFLQAKPSIRLLIFDLDGTLIDSKKDLAVSVQATLRYMRRDHLDDETIFSYVGQGAPALIRRILGDDPSEEEVERGLHFFLRYYNEHKLDHTRLYPGVRETLTRLARGNGRTRRTFAVLTNKPVYPSRGIIEDLGLSELFPLVYGGNSFHSKKPDPVGVHTILEACRADPSETMIVGDSDVDIATGVNAGIWTCGVTYGFGDFQPHHPPDLLVHRFAALGEALQEPHLKSR